MEVESKAEAEPMAMGRAVGAVEVAVVEEGTAVRVRFEICDAWSTDPYPMNASVCTIERMCEMYSTGRKRLPHH